MKRLVASLMLAVSACVAADAQLYPIGDLNEDWRVDARDLQLFAGQWLDDNCLEPGCVADLNGAAGVNGVDYAIFAANWGLNGGVVISEFMASNASSPPLDPGELVDEDGDSSDWIEIYNPTTEPVALGGWRLTDNRTDLNKWAFPPGVVIAPRAFLIVFASGKDRTTGELHTNFALSAAGGYLALVHADGATVVSQYDYPPQLTNVSYGLRQLSQAFAGGGHTVAYRVPQGSDAGIPWTAAAFDDSAWQTATFALGFITQPVNVADVTAPQDTIRGVPNDGDWPSNESPNLAIDNNVNTKYLHFKGDFDPGDPPDGAGFQVTPSMGPSVVTGLTFTTANDAPERDPTSFALYGSNVSISGPYTLIAVGEIVDFRQASPWPRYTRNATPITFSNNTAYSHYQVLFPSIRTPASAVAMQIAEVELLGGAAGSAASDVREQMLHINASLWVRSKFTLTADELDVYDVLSLRMKYEDGYVAYLNGVEVARDNLTGTPQWNSRADGDRPNAMGEEFVGIDLSGRLNLLVEGTNVLAIHALNDGVSNEDFHVHAELSAATNVGQRQYFAQATPGAFNVSGAVDIVGDTRFSVDRGFHDVPFLVEIATDTADATIRFTIDGSTPTETHGLIYTGPIPIGATTCLRAMAYKPGWLSTNVDTQTYIFLDQVIRQGANPAGFPTTWGGTAADYAMDQRVVNDVRYSGLMRDAMLSLPTMSIVTDMNNLFGPTGIYQNPTLEGGAYERPVSVEWINPDGSTGFQIDAGLRIYGGAFRRMDLTRKKTFRLLFKRQYGAGKLNFRLFDADDATTEFDTIILRGGSNDGWNNWGGENTQYIIDEFMRRTQLALGQHAAHGTFVHLYINGLYWGLYNPVERPGQSFAATYYGGDKAQWDAINAGEPVGESTAATWNAMLGQIGQGMATLAAYQKIQGNDPDGTPNPAYDNLLDVDNYIDYLFSNFWGGTGDWGGRNWYVACRRPPNATGFKFFNWDSEGAIIIWSNLNENVTSRAEAIQAPYQALRQNAEFRMSFADHAHRHLFNAGPAMPLASYARYKDLADEVELAIIAESARWGDQARGTPYTLADWQVKRDYILNTYMPQRPAIVLGQLLAAGLYPAVSVPVFKVNGIQQHGGHVLATDDISMTLPQDVSYRDVELVGERAAVRIHIPIDNSLGLSWTARTFVPGAGWSDGSTTTGVGYERDSGYESLIGTDVGDAMYGRSTSVFLRIAFSFDGSENFDRLVLAAKYDDGFVAYLNGTRVCTSGNVTNEIPGTATAGNHEAGAAFEEFDITDFKGSLVVGTNILAIHGINITTTSSDMLILPKLVGKVVDTGGNSQPIWYTLDGSDPRLLGGVRNPAALEYPGAPIRLARSSRVRARTLYNGNWSALNDAVFSVGPVAQSLRISEIMYHPANTGSPTDPNKEYVELVNIGAVAINLNLVRFTNGVQFTFGDTVLNPGEYVLVVRDMAAFHAEYGSGLNVAGQYTGSLDNSGERITLEDAAGTVIHNFRYRDNWYGITDGGGFSLTVRDLFAADPNVLNDKSAWRASAEVGGSPGWDDTGVVPDPGAIVINEVLAHSHAENTDWIELHNTTAEPIHIGGWFLSDSEATLMKYRIADGTVIGPGGYIVFYENLHFGNPMDPGCLTAFALSENGEQVVLSSAVDGVLSGFRATEDFGASPTGIAFGRYAKSGGTFNFVLMSANTPGAANAYPLVGPMVINEIMYNPPSGNQDEEYIELLNISSQPVTLLDPLTLEPWKFTDAIEKVFPTNPAVTVAPGGFLLVVRNTQAFVVRYGVPPAGVQVLQYDSGALDNAGEKLEISMPGDVDGQGVRQYIRVDRVVYSDGSHPTGDDPWPTSADGQGHSLHRIAPAGYGNDVVNWRAAAPTPGASNP